jgi:predicted RNase H-like nuclease (RuvC/YqgF family)
VVNINRYLLDCFDRQVLTSSKLLGEEQARQATRMLEMELKQAGLRERKLLDELQGIKYSAQRVQEELQAMRETAQKVDRDREMDEMARVLSETEHALQRKSQLVGLLERQIKDLTSEVKAKDIHVANLRKDLAQ